MEKLQAELALWKVGSVLPNNGRKRKHKASWTRQLTTAAKQVEKPQSKEQHREAAATAKNQAFF